MVHTCPHCQEPRIRHLALRWASRESPAQCPGCGRLSQVLASTSSAIAVFTWLGVLGSVVLGLASSGVHSNGFSLVRKCIERAGSNAPATLDGKPFKQALMEPTRLYVLNVLAALAAHPTAPDSSSGIKALAHITGGGLLENIPRVLPEGTAAHLTKGSWPQTELFAWLQKTAGIDDIEMNRTFNNGIGMVVVVDAANAEATAATLRAAGEQVYTIGTIAARGEGAAVVVA